MKNKYFKDKQGIRWKVLQYFPEDGSCLMRSQAEKTKTFDAEHIKNQMEEM